MDGPDRRAFLCAGVAAPAALVTTDAGSVAEAGATIDDGLAMHAARWDATPMATVLADCERWAVVCRTVGMAGSPGWQRRAGWVALLSARAYLDSGRADGALALAQQARVTARASGDLPTALHADLVAAEVWDAAQPDSYDVPLNILAQVRQRGGTSWIAATAAVLAANLSARRGDAERALILVKGSEFLAERLGNPEPGEYTSAHLAAFGANAMVRVGLLAEARPRLERAAFLAEQQGPGLRSAVEVYRSSAALTGGDLAEAATHARTALELSDGRPTAWLARSVLGQARRARGQDGWEALAYRVASWQMI